MSSLKDRLDAHRKSIADNKASFIRAYKFHVGKTVIRVLPGVKVPEEFFRLYGAHYIKDPTTDALLVVVGDAHITYDKPDPIRDGILQFSAAAALRGDDQVAKKAKSWLGKRTNVLNMVIEGGADSESKGKTVQGEFSDNAFDQILSVIQTMEENNVGSIENGFLLTVERVGTTQTDTRYTFSMFPKQPEHPPTAAVLAARIDLDTYVDAKFTSQVSKALQVLSSMLGRDISSSPAAQKLLAMTGAKVEVPAISAPTGTIDLGETTADLLAIDAEFEPVADVAPDPAPTPAVKTAPAPTAPAADLDDFDSILKDLDNL